MQLPQPRSTAAATTAMTAQVCWKFNQMNLRCYGECNGKTRITASVRLWVLVMAAMQRVVGAVGSIDSGINMSSAFISMKK